MVDFRFIGIAWLLNVVDGLAHVNGEALRLAEREEIMRPRWLHGREDLNGLLEGGFKR
jgi:hypothetical protein